MKHRNRVAYLARCVLALAVILPGLASCDGEGPTEETEAAPDHFGGIVFQSGEVLNPFFVDVGWIYVAREDGSNVFRLEEGGTPAWSPDGRRIAYSGEPWVGAKQGDIFVLDLETGEKARITETGDHDLQPQWSPDGTRISFTRCLPDHCRAHIMKADGTGVRAVEGHPWDAWQVIWSPDGGSWLYSKPLGGLNYEIFLSDTLGGNEVRRTESSFPDVSPNWSPDGNRIAYLTIGADGYSGAYPGIYVMDADGKNRIMLSEPRGDSLKSDPAWSADGREVLFALRPERGDMPFELVVVRAEAGGTARRLGVVGRSPQVVASSPRRQ
jgi:Tol biopolymer transport system component